jgi:hypothetical protein
MSPDILHHLSIDTYVLPDHFVDRLHNWSKLCRRSLCWCHSTAVSTHSPITLDKHTPWVEIVNLWDNSRQSARFLFNSSIKVCLNEKGAACHINTHWLDHRSRSKWDPVFTEACITWRSKVASLWISFVFWHEAAIAYVKSSGSIRIEMTELLSAPDSSRRIGNLSPRSSKSFDLQLEFVDLSYYTAISCFWLHTRIELH